jgi:O-antigen ligase
VRALWLGRAAVGLVFLGWLLGGAVSAVEALGLAFALALLAGGAWMSVPSPLPLRRLSVAAAAFLIVIGVCLLTILPLPQVVERSGLYAPVGGRSLSIAPTATLIEIAKLLGLACAFLCGVFTVRSRRVGGRVIDACIIMTALWAAWSLILFIAAGGQVRLGTPFQSPNTAATLLGVGVVLTTGRLLAWRDARRKRTVHRWELAWLAAAILLLAFTLLLTQSRAGVAVTALCAAGLFAFWPRERGPSSALQKWLAVGGFAAAGLVVLDAGRGVAGRLGGLADAAADRREIFGVYWAAFADSPLFGGGLGTATYVTKLALTPQTYDALWNIQSAHNWALQWLAEGGVAAAAPMAVAIGSVLLVAIRGLDARSAPVLLPLLFSDVVILLHGLTDFALQIPAVAIYWSFLLGLQAAMGGRRPGERAGRIPENGEGLDHD